MPLAIFSVLLNCMIRSDALEVTELRVCYECEVPCELRPT
jgi:hypothetical protein